MLNIALFVTLSALLLWRVYTRMIEYGAIFAAAGALGL